MYIWQYSQIIDLNFHSHKSTHSICKIFKCFRLCNIAHKTRTKQTSSPFFSPPSSTHPLPPLFDPLIRDINCYNKYYSTGFSNGNKSKILLPSIIFGLLLLYIKMATNLLNMQSVYTMFNDLKSIFEEDEENKRDEEEEEEEENWGRKRMQMILYAYL